jgi:hypothetical protein
MDGTDYRPLTAEEQALLIWLLEHGIPDAKNFLPQVNTLRARSSCACGCPSIEFIVPLDAPYIATTRGTLAAFTGKSGGVDIVLALFAGGGVLSKLDVSAIGETDRPFGLPPVESLWR